MTIEVGTDSSEVGTVRVRQYGQFREAYGEEISVMYAWFCEVGYEANIDAARVEYPALSTLEGCLVRHGGQGAASWCTDRVQPHPV